MADGGKPLAPASLYSVRSDEDEAMSQHFKLRRRKCLAYCGCVTALLLILAVTLLILTFTVFKVEHPSIKMNNVTLKSPIEFSNGTLRSDVNITLLADVSVKNRNVASFRYGNSTTEVYYDGLWVGEGRIPAGKAAARRTVRMNVTVELVPAKLLAVPSLESDFSKGVITMESCTKIGGRVKILRIIRKHVEVILNCTMSYDITSQAIQQNCNNHISL